jgi:hypothetical protein
MILAALALAGVAAGCGSRPDHPAPVASMAVTVVPGADTGGADNGGNGDTGGADNGGADNGGAPTGLDRSHWVGIWHAEVPDGFGVSQVEMILQANGKFSEQTTNASANYQLTVTGEWDIFTFTDRPMLRFTVTNWEPKEWCGPLGCSAVNIPTGMSEYFAFIDATHVQITQANCTSACESVYTRVS